MKIRNGFISNSSSSSFVAVITKSAFDKTLEQVHPYVKAVIEAIEKEEGIFTGIDVVTIGIMNIHGDSTIDNIEIDYDLEKNPLPEDMDNSPYEALDTFLASIPEGQIITHSEDC